MQQRVGLGLIISELTYTLLILLLLLLLLVLLVLLLTLPSSSHEFLCFYSCTLPNTTLHSKNETKCEMAGFLFVAVVVAAAATVTVTVAAVVAAVAAKLVFTNDQPLYVQLKDKTYLLLIIPFEFRQEDAYKTLFFIYIG